MRIDSIHQRDIGNRRQRSVARRLAVLSAATLAGVPALPAMASSIARNSSLNATLSSTGAWVGGAVPGAGDTAVWNSNLSGNTVDVLGASLTIGELQITNPGGNVTINNDGFNLTLNGLNQVGLDMSSATANLSIGNSITVGGPQTWTVTSGRTFADSSPTIAGSAGADLLLSGSGTYDLNKTNTNGIAAGWIVQNGTDFVTANGATLAVSTPTYTSDTWGSTFNTTVTLATNTLGSSSTTNSLRFASNAADTLTLSGNNSITSGGILISSAVGSNNESVTGGTLQTTSANGLVVNQFGTGIFNISSVIAGSSALTKGGPGTLVLSGANTYTGGTYVDAGTLNTTSTSALGNGAITVNGGNLNLNYTGSASTSGFTISAGNLTIGSGATLTSSSTSRTFTQTGGTLAINGSLVLPGDTFLYNGGSITGTGSTVTLDNTTSTTTLSFGAGAGNSGNFILTGTSSGSSNLIGNIPSGVGVTFQPSATTTFTSSINLPSPFTNNGTFILTNAGSSSIVGANGSTFTNAGILTTNPGTGGARTLSGTTTNTSTGTININANTALSGNFTNSDTVNVATGTSLSMSSTSQAFTQTAGTLNLNGSLVLPGDTFLYNGGSITGTGSTVTLDNTPSSTTLSFGAGAGNSGNFILTGTSSGSSSLIGNIPSGVGVTFQPSATSTFTSSINLPSPFTNNGTFILTNAGSSSIVGANGSTFTNAGILTTNPGTGEARTLSGTTTNTSTGTININANTALIGNFTNSGTVNVATGTSLSMSSTSQAFTQTTGNLNLNGSLVLPGDTFLYNGGSITGTGSTVTLDNTPSSTTLSFGAGAGNSGNFILTGSASGSSSLIGNIPSGVGVTFQPSATSTFTSSISLPSPFTNNGTFVLTNAGSSSIVGANGSTFTNAGTLSTNPGTGGARTLSGTTTNTSTGTININANTALSGNFTNSGTVNVASGTSLSMSSTSQAFTQTTGNLNLNGSLVLPGDTFLYNGGSITGTNATVTLSNNSSVVNLNFGAGAGNSGNFLLTGTGSGNTAMSGNIPSGVSVSFQPSSSNATSTSLTNSASFTNSGTIVLSSSNAANNVSLGSGSFALTNAGTITTNAGTGGSRTIGASLTNTSTGTLNINTSTTLSNSWVNQGAVNIAAGQTLSIAASPRTFTMSGGTVSIASTGVLNLTSDILALNGGTISLNADSALGSGSTTISMNGGALGTFASFTTARNITLNSGGGTLIPALATTLTDSGVFSGTGPLTVTGVGTVLLTGQSTNTGVTTIASGTLALDNSTSTALAGNVVIGDGTDAATLLLDLPNQLSTSATVTVNNNGVFNVNNQSQTINTLTINTGGSVQGNTNLTVDGNDLFVSDGSVVSSNTTLNFGLTYTTSNGSSGALISGNVTLGTGDHIFTIAHNTTPGVIDTTVSGTISGTGNLIKNGPGILLLDPTGSNTYTGTTTVNAGTLQLNGGGVAVPGNLTINSGGTVTLLTSNQIGFSADVTVNSGGSLNLGAFSQTIGSLAGSGSVTLGIPTAAVLTVGDDNASTAWSGFISGNGALVKTGNGTFTINSGNMYIGGTTVSAGTLVLNVASGGAITGNLFVSGGTVSMGAANELSSTAAVVVGPGSMAMNNNSQAIGSLAGPFSGTVALGTAGLTVGNDNTSTTFAGSITGTGTVAKVGTGILSLTGSSSFSGGLNVTGGTVSAASDSALGAGPIAVGGTLSASQSFATSKTITMVGGTSATIDTVPSAVLTENGVVTGVILTKTGAGTLVLAGNNTYTGSTTINGGIVSITSPSNLGTGTAVNLAGGTLQATSVLASSLQRDISVQGGGGDIDLAAGAAMSIIGSNNSTAALQGSHALTVSGAGTLTLLGTSSSFSGAITVTGGTLVAQLDGQLGNGFATVTLNGGTFQNSAGFASTRSFTMGSVGGTFDTPSATTLTLSSAVTGGGGLTKIDTGTLVINTASTYGGATNIIAGSLQTPGDLPANSDVTLSTGATLDLTTASSTANVGSLSGGGNVLLGTASISVGGNNNSTTFAGVISGSGGLTKTGTGTTTLSAANSYGGTTTVSGGTLAIGVNNAIPTTSALTISNSAIVDLIGNSQSVPGLVGTSSTANITNSGAAAAILTLTTLTNHTTSYAGTISGNLSLVLNSFGGSQTLTNSNSYTGSTTIVYGTLNVGANNAVPSTSPVSLGISGQLNLNNTFSDSIGPLSGTGAVLLGNGSTLTINLNGTSTFNGSIDGSGSVTTAGNGTLVLTHSNNFNGPLSINGGTVSIATDTYLGTTVSVSLSGGTLATTATTSSSRTYTVNNGAVDVAPNTTFSVSGNISGSNFTKTDSGTLVLTGTNSLTGTLNVQAGILYPSVASAIPNGLALVLGSGATLDLNTISIQGGPKSFASLSGNGNLIDTYGGEVDVGTDNSNSTFGGVISGYGDFKKLGNGTLTLTNQSTYGRNTEIYGGIIKLGINEALPVTTFLSMPLGGPALDLNGFSQATTDPAVVINSSPTLGTYSIYSNTEGLAGFNGTISGNTQVIFTSYHAGYPLSGWEFNGADSFTGGLVVTGGTLELADPSSGTRTSSGGITLDPGGTLETLSDTALGSYTNNQITLNGGTLEPIQSYSSSRDISLGINGGNFNVVNGNGVHSTLTYSGSVVGSAPLSANGNGTLVITSNQGALTGLVSVGTGTVVLTGTSGAFSAVLGIDANLNGTLTLDNSSGNSTIPGGRISPSANLTMYGGTLNLVGSSAAASNQSLNQLILGGAASTISVSGTAGNSAAITFTGGLNATRGAGASVNFVGTNLGSTNQIFLTGQSTTAGQPAGAIGGWATVNGTDFAKYSANGVVPYTSGTGGDYTVNQFTAGADVKLDPTVSTPALPSSIPTVAIQSLNISGTSAINLTATGSTLTINGGGLLKSGSSPTIITGGTLESGSGELDAYVQANNGYLQFTGVLANNGSTPLNLVKSGIGMLSLGGGVSDTAGNTFTGSIYVQQGTLQLNKAGGPGAYAVNGAINITGGTVIQTEPNEINPLSSIIVTSGTYTGTTGTAQSFTNINGTATTGNLTVIIGELDGGTTMLGGLTVTGADGSSPGSRIHPAAGGAPPATAMNISGGVNECPASQIFSVTSLTFKGDANNNNSGSILLDAGTTAGTMQLNNGIYVTGFNGAATINTGAVQGGQNPGTLDLINTGTAHPIQVVTQTAGLNISAQVIDSGAMNILGAGTVQLSNSNTYSGGTTLSGSATLQVTNTNGLGTGAVAFAGGTLQLENDNASPTFSNAVTTAATSTISIDVEPISNSTAGSFAMTSASLGVALNVTGSALGSLTFPGNVTLQNNGSTATAIFTDIPLTLSGVISQTGSNGGILLGSAPVNFNGSYSSPSTLTFSGTGSNSYNGTTTVAGGKLILGKSGTAIPHGLTVQGGGTVQFAASAMNQINSSFPVTIDGTVGPAVLDLNGGSNTFSASPYGLIFTVGGTLQTEGGQAILGSDVEYTTGSGGNGTGSITGNLAMGTTGRTFNIARGAASVDMSIPAVISGTPSPAGTVLTKSGAGVLALSGSNSYGGASDIVSVTGGVLQIVNDGNLGNSLNTIALSTGGDLQAAASFSTNRTITLGTGGGTLDVTGTNTFTLGGAISGTTGLTKMGTGTLVLTVSNSFSGGITINGGVISVSADNQLGDSSNAITLAGGSLVTTGTLTLTRQIIFNGIGGAFNVPLNNPVTLNSTVGGSGGLSKSGPGTLTVAGTQNWSNGAVIANIGGIVNLNTSANTSSGNPVLSVSVSGGATTNLNAAQSLVGVSIASGGVLATNASGATLASTGPLTISGSGGQINLAMQGATFTGTGATSWAGTLVDSGSNPLTINRTGGAVTVTAASTINISQSQASLSAGGSVDPFTDSSNSHQHVAIANSGIFSITAGTKGVASLSGSGGTTIAAGSALNVGSSPGTINQATLSVAGALATNGGSGTTNASYGPVTLTGSGPTALNITTTGSAQLGDVSFTGTLGGATVASGGSLTANSIRGGSLTVGGNVLVRSSTAHTGVSVLTGGLGFTGTGKLDLTNNDMIVRSTSLGTITTDLHNGFNANGPLWTGPGIISSTAQGNLLTALGAILNSASNGSILFTTFDGQTNLANTDVLVKYTYFGDTNFDGQVTGTDYTNIDAGYGNHLSGWANGDFNYDGVVDGSDYSLIDNTFNMQTTSMADEIAANSSGIATPSSITGATVPEPSSIALLVFAGALATRRRRRAQGGARAAKYPF